VGQGPEHAPMRHLLAKMAPGDWREEAFVFVAQEPLTKDQAMGQLAKFLAPAL